MTKKKVPFEDDGLVWIGDIEDFKNHMNNMCRYIFFDSGLY